MCPLPAGSMSTARIGFDKPFTAPRAAGQGLPRSTKHRVVSGEQPESLSMTSPAQAASSKPTLSAAERVLAAELEARGASSGALSMMVSSMVQMVQAGQTPQSRWKAS